MECVTLPAEKNIELIPRSNLFWMSSGYPDPGVLTLHIKSAFRQQWQIGIKVQALQQMSNFSLNSTDVVCPATEIVMVHNLHNPMIVI